MDFTLKLFLMLPFLLGTVKAELETDFITEADEDTKYFILEQNGVMMRVFKEEMVQLFATMSTSFNQKMASLDSKMEMSMQNVTEMFSRKLSTTESDMENSLQSLSASFNQNLDASDSKIESSLNLLTDSFIQKQNSRDSRLEISLQYLLNSFGQKLESTDLKVEDSLRGLSNSFSQKQTTIETSLQNISETYDQKVTKSESRAVEQLESLKTTIHATLQRHPLLRRTAVEEVSGKSGTIEFEQEPNSTLKRKIWIIQGNGHHWNITVNLEENKLGQNSHLSVWSIGERLHVWNGSESDSKNEVKFSGVNFVLITLSIVSNSVSNLSDEYPSFNLTFHSKLANSNPSYVNSKELITSEGLQFVSHPPENSQNYPQSSIFYSLIAPSSGNEFRLTLKYMDIPGNATKCTSKYFAVYSLQENASGTNYERLPATESRRCGQVGHISQFLGHSEVAFVYFWSSTEEVGKGFRIEIEPSE